MKFCGVNVRTNAIKLNMNLELLTEREVSRLLSINEATLRKSRMEKRGMPYVRLGRVIRYRRQDVEAWVENNRHAELEANLLDIAEKSIASTERALSRLRSFVQTCKGESSD